MTTEVDGKILLVLKKSPIVICFPASDFSHDSRFIEGVAGLCQISDPSHT
jgi:hypothetical protein